MKLSLVITDSRLVQTNAYSPATKREEYERVSVDEATMNRATLAGFLRSIADDLDPTLALCETADDAVMQP